MGCTLGVSLDAAEVSNSVVVRSFERKGINLCRVKQNSAARCGITEPTAGVPNLGRCCMSWGDSASAVGYQRMKSSPGGAARIAGDALNADETPQVRR